MGTETSKELMGFGAVLVGRGKRTRNNVALGNESDIEKEEVRGILMLDSLGLVGQGSLTQSLPCRS